MIARYRAPAGMGIRVDSAAGSDEEIPAAYDSLIAKVVAWGRDREEAAARMRGALTEMVVDGLPTTREFHLRLLDHAAWQAGDATTTFLDRHPEVLPPPAAVGTAQSERAEATTEMVAEVDGRRFEIRLHGTPGTTALRGTAAPRPAVAPRRPSSGGESAVALLRSPIQGTIVRLAVAPGETVRRGETVCVVEAMKMENDVTAHRDGMLTRMVATLGAPVRVGDPLAEIN
jgi:acetyl-CoA/propionyl-CoA carboxylase biotin carboxyl carrier protein